MIKDHMHISNVVLKWARETAGYSIETLSSKSGLAKYVEWEAGESFPTYPQLEKLAATLKRPIAVFFFPKPPREESIEKSLRAMSLDDLENLSPKMRFLFRKAKNFQISLYELLSDESDLQEKKVAWLKGLKDQTIVGLADKVRNFLNVPLYEQKSWQDSEEALKEWQKNLAEHGLYIFKDAFKDEKIAGFCLYDELFPIIYINNSMPKNRQIFTIFHELAHILFKESYLDVFSQQFWQLEFQDPTHIEVMCNAFAGEFLVPDSDFGKQVQGNIITDSVIGQLAKNYHVSMEVILRKFLNQKRIDREFYEKKVAEWQLNFGKGKESSKLSGGGDYYNSIMYYLGDAYLSLVINKLNQGQISIGEAATHLDIKETNFSEIEERFHKRGVANVRF